MKLIQIVLIIFTVFLLSTGQILFKLASKDLNLTYAGFITSLLSSKLMIAFTVYAIATLLWLILLKGLPLRVVYPFSALAFLIVPTLAHYLLGEAVSWNTYAGAFIIMIGITVSAIQ